MTITYGATGSGGLPVAGATADANTSAPSNTPPPTSAATASPPPALPVRSRLRGRRRRHDDQRRPRNVATCRDGSTHRLDLYRRDRRHATALARVTVPAGWTAPH